MAKAIIDGKRTVPTPGEQGSKFPYTVSRKFPPLNCKHISWNQIRKSGMCERTWYGTPVVLRRLPFRGGGGEGVSVRWELNFPNESTDGAFFFSLVFVCVA